jgi:protein TonB
VTSSPATLEPEGGPLEEQKEPLATVFGLGGGREDSVVFVVALMAALAVHAVAGARAMRVFPYLAELSAAVRVGMQDRLRSQVDIDMTEPPKPPEPPPPEPEPEPEPPPPARQVAPEQQAPPAAAEAGKVLTAEADPDAPVDLTDPGFVSGDGDRFAGGVTASGGTSKTAVRNPAAVATGIGTGTPKATVVAAPKVDMSRAPTVLDKNWDCPFPSEADAEGVNSAKVHVVVTVAPDGRARTVTVVKDPGFGFGKAARTCAMRKAYASALDASGKPIEQTFSVNVRFTR